MASIYVEVNKTQEDQPGVASVSADSPLSSSGGADPVISIDYVPVNQAGDTMTGALSMAAQSPVKFYDANSSDAVTVEAPTNVTAYTLKLPTAQGAARSTVINDGSGNLSFGEGVGYTATTASDWATSPPTTIKAALDRCAALLKVLNGGTGP